jgi:hypothetical protein
MRLLVCVLLSTVVVSAQNYPPPYPRSGTTSLIDNARVLAWDVSWPKGTPAVIHRHLYDMTGIYYWPGDRLITSADGTKRNTSTAAGRIQWQLKGVTHSEEGTSDDPLRAVMIELKGDGPSGKVVKQTQAPAFTTTTMPLLDNERVTVWDVPATAARTSHAHPMDTVVVWTEGRTGHAVFLPAGTVHAAEPMTAGAKATIFELK